jgi:hypothetical protein
MGAAALMGAATLSAPSAHAVSGTATLAPGSTVTAPVGSNFDLDFSGIFTDPLMAAGNYWEFNIGSVVGNSSFSNLGWEVSTDNATTWNQVDWSTLDPIGSTSATTTPALDGSNNFPAGTNTISLGLGAPGTTLDSAYLAKANYAGLTNVRIVGTVSGASTPYLTKVSISDLSWNGVDSPIFNNAYQANLSNVPGPLPVLGAIGALGMARRLRKRVHAGATA